MGVCILYLAAATDTSSINWTIEALTTDLRHFRGSGTEAEAIVHYLCLPGGKTEAASFTKRQMELMAAFLLPYALSPKETCPDSTCSASLGHSIKHLASSLKLATGRDHFELGLTIHSSTRFFALTVYPELRPEGILCSFGP